MRQTALFLLVAVGQSACIASSMADDKPSPAHTVKSFSLADTRGKIHTADDWRGTKGVVLFVLGTDCPVANGYAPLMQRLADAYGPKGFIFYGMHPDPEVTAEAAARHAKEYQLKFPVLLDGGQRVVGQTGARVLGQVVLMSPEGEVLYQGRLDDRYTETGKRRDEARVNDVANALEAVLAGKSPPVRETKAFGCPLPKVRGQESGVRNQD